MAQHFADMFVDGGTDPRAEPPARGDERSTLHGFLRWHRQTLELKCAGLDAEALARRALAPSNLSLLGLVRHMADVERGWFRRRLAGQDAPSRFRLADDPDGDFDHATADPALVDEAFAYWREEAEFTDWFITELTDLDRTIEGRHPDGLSARWVMVHIVEEYARHNGHADILRERIDGRVGQ